MSCELGTLWSVASWRVFGVVTSAVSLQDILVSTTTADGLFHGKGGLGLEIELYEQGLRFPSDPLDHILRDQQTVKLSI